MTLLSHAKLVSGYVPGRIKTARARVSAKFFFCLLVSFFNLFVPQ